MCLQSNEGVRPCVSLPPCPRAVLGADPLLPAPCSFPAQCFAELLEGSCALAPGAGKPLLHFNS